MGYVVCEIRKEEEIQRYVRDSAIEEGTTLDRFIFETTRVHHGAQGQFATLLQQMALAARLVSARVNRAGLAGILGATGEQNIQGEVVQKLDIYANETFKGPWNTQVFAVPLSLKKMRNLFCSRAFSFWPLCRNN